MCRMLGWTDDSEGRRFMREVLANHMSLPANRERFEELMPQLPAAWRNADGTSDFDRYLEWIRMPHHWG
jgi:hypothetical protein